MKNDSRTKPFQKDDFFKDKSSARPLEEGTIPRGYLKYPTPFFTGKKEGRYVTNNPVSQSREFFQRGQERYNIYCAVCHGRTGEGNGMVVQRGFPRPPSFHIDRLRQAPDGYFFDIITYGKGKMASDRDVLDEHDRWAVTAYIRALQKSQYCRLSDAPKNIRNKLKNQDSKNAGPIYE